VNILWREINRGVGENADITRRNFKLAGCPAGRNASELSAGIIMIRKLKSGQYRLYSKKKDPKTGKRKNLGTFATRAAAEKHERAVQYFKRH
jgi:hypothetical protein